MEESYEKPLRQKFVCFFLSRKRQSIIASK